MRRLFFLVAGLSAATAVFGTAVFADGSLTISVAPAGRIASQDQADVSVTVACAPLSPQTDGSVVVSLTQQSGSKTTTGTGSTSIDCDGQSHNHVVTTVASTGRWHNGPATATATATADGYYSTTACGTDSNGDVVCTINQAAARDSGSSGPTIVTLGTD